MGWRNVSTRTHTVTGVDFDSGRLPTGRGYSHTFPAEGTFAYHCRIHPSIQGEVVVSPVILSASATTLLKGDALELSGRTMAGIASVAIVENRGGTDSIVATPAVGSDRSFHADLHADADASYRAIAGDATSAPVKVAVTDRRRVTVTRTSRRGVATLRVGVTPGLPGGTVVLQVFLRERFGWWPVSTRKLDADSHATFKHAGRAPARVVLTAPDGATPLAVSRIVRVPA